MSEKSYNRILNIAFRDIHKWIEKEYKIHMIGNGRRRFIEKNIITRREVDTNETHKLNQELKIRGLNMFGNTNSNQQ